MHAGKPDAGAPMHVTHDDGDSRRDDSDRDALARMDTRVLACDPARLVIRTSMFVRASKRARIALAVSIVALLTTASAAFWLFVVPGVPLLPTAGLGFIGGALAAYGLLYETRLVATAGGPGLLLERHSPFRRPKSRRLVVSFVELTGYDVRPVLDDDSCPGGHVAWVLRLHAGSRRIDAWSALEHDVADAVGWRLMRLAEREPPEGTAA